MKIGIHTIHFWCRLQSGVALSSGEAELVSMIKGCGEGLLIRHILKEMSFEMGLKVFCDSSSARGTSNREGVGKIKHLETKHLWSQEKVKSGDLTIHWIPRKQNPSDALTHKLPGNELQRILSELGWRPAAAPGEARPSPRRGICILDYRHGTLDYRHTFTSSSSRVDPPVYQSYRIAPEPLASTTRRGHARAPRWSVSFENLLQLEALRFIRHSL